MLNLLANFQQRYFADIGVLKAEQVEAIKACLHSDVFALLATGSGKSLIYQMAALVLAHRLRGAKTLVVMPLTALIAQQREFLQKRGVSSSFYTPNDFNMAQFFAGDDSLCTFLIFDLL